MECPSATAARLRVWGVTNDSQQHSTILSDEDTETIESSAVRNRCQGRRNVYTNDLKVKVLDDINAGVTVTEAARRHDVQSRPAIYVWMKHETELRDACKNQKRSKVTLGGQGRRNLFPWCDELVQWIKLMRRDDFPLKTSHVLTFVKEEYSEFTTAYLANNLEDSLGRMMRRIISQYGFSFRRPSKSILSSQDLEAEQTKFAADVGAGINATYERACIFNADETAVYYDDTPTRIINERGSKKAAKVKGRTRSERASVLLIVSATGRKLRPVIIFKGQPGGRVEEEVRGISDKVITAVQTNAWMDSSVWLNTFIEETWGGFVSDVAPGPLALYVDNLKCHVSTEAEEALASWGTELVPLPKNTTSVLQPLDVGVMGPFKQKLRAIMLSYELGMIGSGGNIPLRERLLQLQRLPAPEKRKRLVERVIAAWDALSEDSVKKAWIKAGL